MSVCSMTVTDTHHPKVLDSCEIIMHDKGILIRLLLARDESLSSFHSIIEDWSLYIIVELCNLDLTLVLADMGRIIGFWSSVY